MTPQECKASSEMFELLQALHNEFPEVVPEVEEIFTRKAKDFLQYAVCLNWPHIPLCKN